MLPGELKPDEFHGYPPAARELAEKYLSTLQQLPVSFVPNLLREVIEYDYKFPAERDAIESELASLSALSPEQRKQWFEKFEGITLSSKLEHENWVATPAQFVEQLSAYLWTTHQLDAFRGAAIDYQNRLHAAAPPKPPAIPRLGIAVIGQGVNVPAEPLFRKLRPHGAYFSRVKPENGLQMLLDAVSARAKAHPTPYGHWYIDGGTAAEHDSGVTCVSYAALAQVRSALLRKIKGELAKPGMGPEELRTYLAQLNPAELGLSEKDEAVLNRFQVKLLTEGSGTQIFATIFAQWAAREALRRAQPLTVLVRFAPRQRQRPMNELLSGVQEGAELDPAGSLVDADIGAYYNWINQQRLPGAEQGLFLAWFENHGEAVVVAPTMPRGTESTTVADLHELLSWIS